MGNHRLIDIVGKHCAGNQGIPFHMNRTLWQNSGFMRLWLAQILSNTGSTITDVALPLTAVLTLGATPAQMGLLGMMGSTPNLLFGLFG